MPAFQPRLLFGYVCPVPGAAMPTTDRIAITMREVDRYRYGHSGRDGRETQAATDDRTAGVGDAAVSPLGRGRRERGWAGLVRDEPCARFQRFGIG
ncbi:hypothetical protein A8E24_19875 [Burkholderia cenocepacia]|nr:hypothetical protein A8E24_19875 [Burkholderia cenocepacia]